MPRFRKKPVIVEAMRWDGTNWEEISTFTGSHGWIKGDWIIKTLEGEMKASPGDWIIKGVKGEFYPCKPDIFEQTYEGVKDEQK